MKTLRFEPAAPSNWLDVERLFGTNGICGGCWCMWWRKKSKDYDAEKGGKNKRDLRTLVDRGECPGLLFYSGSEPVGWCSVGPRDNYGRLNRSPVLAPVDDESVWSIVCVHVRKDYRRRGLSGKMIAVARDYAIGGGAKVVEGYPVDPRKPDFPEVFAQTGFKPSFDANKFVEVTRRSKSRSIMRYVSPTSR